MRIYTRTFVRDTRLEPEECNRPRQDISVGGAICGISEIAAPMYNVRDSIAAKSVNATYSMSVHRANCVIVLGYRRGMQGFDLGPNLVHDAQHSFRVFEPRWQLQSSFEDAYSGQFHLCCTASCKLI